MRNALHELTSRLAVAITAVSLSALPSTVPADEPGSRWSQTVDASIGIARDRGTAAVSWNHLYAVLPDRLALGIGARLASLYASGPLVFRTGDPELFSAGQRNRLVLEDPRVTSLNLQVLAIARVVGPVEAGFDLDLFGFSVGPGRMGEYEATDPRLSGVQSAEVANLDLFLTSVRDRGQLFSEFFLGVRLGPTWTIRAGLSHVVTGYRSAAPLDDGNREFKRFTTQGFVGVSARVR